MEPMEALRHEQEIVNVIPREAKRSRGISSESQKEFRAFAE